MADPVEPSVLIGTVERVVFRNDGGFAVLEFGVDDGSTVMAAGSIPDPLPGQHLRLVVVRGNADRRDLFSNAVRAVQGIREAGDAFHINETVQAGNLKARVGLKYHRPSR